MRLFAELLKDATVRSVHVTTALGGESVVAQRRRKELEALNGGSPEPGPNDLDSEDGEADIATSKVFGKANVVKVDGELGLVFGFAIVCKRNGEDYFDLQDDHITERAMLAAAADFMLKSRLARDMHETDDGTVVFAFPLTTEIAKALNIVTPDTGLLIAMKPSAAMLAKFKDGTYTGFSIGGLYGSVAEID